MNSLFVFALLILTAILPVIILYIWKGRIKLPLSLPWFLTALAAGIVSLVIAALAQNFFPFPLLPGSVGSIFLAIFVRIAFIEEVSRLFTLFPLIKAATPRRDLGFAAALGLAAGLGFAAAENAFYGMANIGIIVLRIFTAAPLHGACAIRAAAALFKFRTQPVRAIFLFLSAVIIHGAYNLIIVSPAIPGFLAVPTALIALFISLPLIKDNMNDENVLI